LLITPAGQTLVLCGGTADHETEVAVRASIVRSVRAACGLAAALAVCAGGGGCVADRYIIGAYDAGGIAPGGGGGASGGAAGGSDGGAPTAAACSAGGSCRFSVDLNLNGVSFLPEALALPPGAVTASLRYSGTRAASDGWHADHGSLLAPAAGVTQQALATPFIDATVAVGLATDAPSFVATDGAAAVSTGDFVVELVFRAAPGAPIVGQGTTAAGWSLATNSAGALVLALGDGTHAAQIVSEALSARAWYHCLVWVGRGQGGRIDCDGRAGVLTDLAGVGDVSAASPLTVGGAAGGALLGVQLALFQLFVAAPGALGDPASWQVLSHQRFAALTGVFPRLATGTALPKDGLRDSLAYVDIQQQSGGARQLFLVGPDWPRIACRTDAVGSNGCGYFAEPSRMQLVDPDPAKWTLTELTATPGAVTFVDVDQTMKALIPSTNAVAHTLLRHATFSGPRQGLSFFAHSGAGHLIGVEVAAHGQAVFDLEAGTVATAPANASATIEDWGHQIFRCTYTFTVEGGALDYRLTLLNDAAAATFAGDGSSPWIHVAGLQLDANRPYLPLSLMAVNPQAADQLTYVADDGNLPVGATGLHLSVALPAGPRLNDQAMVNINRGGSFNDQVNLYLQQNRGIFYFVGLNGTGTAWSFGHTANAIDGVRHEIDAQWGGATEQVSVDGVAISKNASKTVAAPTGLDRLDVGFSLNSSTYLQGLQAGLQIRGP
jgi:hypothetical protein